MADETNTTVAGVENATQEKEKKLYVYYFSDPDAKDPLLRFHIIYSDVEFAELPWHVHTEKPDENLKSPVWSNAVNGWVEDSKDGQAEILAQAQAKIKELDEKGKQLDQATDKVDQAVKAMQQVQLQNTQQNAAMMKSFTAQTQNTNKLLASMQQTLALVVKANQANATPAAPAQSQTAASTTDASASQTQPVSDNQ